MKSYEITTDLENTSLEICEGKLVRFATQEEAESAIRAIGDETASIARTPHAPTFTFAEWNSASYDA